MGAATDYLEMKILTHLLGTTTWTVPANVYLGLFTVAPTDSTAGTEVTIGSNGYVRLLLTKADATWTGLPTAGAGVISNASELTFATATGAGWGTIVAVGIFDASSAGNLEMYGLVTPNKVVGAGDIFKFLIGDLDITLD